MAFFSSGAEAFTFSVTELRHLTILQRIPFVIPFDKRVQVFNLLLQEDKNENQRGSGWGPGEANVNLRIRRDYIYEDAFDKLRPENGEISFVFCFFLGKFFFVFRTKSSTTNANSFYQCHRLGRSWNRWWRSFSRIYERIIEISV